jgi:hypothetical protein
VAVKQGLKIFDIVETAQTGGNTQANNFVNGARHVL